MRFLITIALSCLWVTPAHSAEPVGAKAQAEADEKSNFFVHLNCSPQNVRAVLSTLQLTKSLSNDESDVTLFIDLQAVLLAEGDSHAVGDKDRAAVEAAFDKLCQSGVHILVCPHCAQELGVAADRIRKGARFTSKEEVRAATDRADKVFEYHAPLEDTDETVGDSLADT